MKRALRVDKIRLAAIEATLKLYRDPDRIAEQLPTYRHLAKPPDQIAALGHRLLPALRAKLGGPFSLDVIACASQIGSGALPLETIPSAGIAIRPTAKRGTGRTLGDLTDAFARLPVPVIGRIENQAFIIDLRCLDDEVGFIANLASLELPSPTPSGSAASS
jgi:L-seryl-tRNA(Ser) seleniumtransferase